METSVKVTLIIVSAIVLLSLFGGFAIYNITQNPLKETTIDVTGNSVIKVTPDLVKVYFNMETNASTSSEATNLNAEQVDKMITSLLKLGLERSAIQTQNFNVWQWQEWENNMYVDKGYKARHQIVVELNKDQFLLIGEVIDAGANAEAIISYINFELSNAKQNEYKALVYKQASEDARIKAESIAEGLGKDVGDLVKVSINEWSYSPWPIYASKSMDMVEETAMAKEATTNIVPSTQEISGYVSVTYELK